MQRILVYK